MTQAERSEDVASEPRIARGDDANGLSEAAKFMRKFVSKKMVAIHPVEFLITPASIADITALKAMQIDVRFGSALYGDEA